jgi:hypothetical protein
LSELKEVAKSSEAPLVFISHDSRDADLAEAFSKLLKSVSAGMLKSFRSSDRKGLEGIEFGDEWYKTLMSKLDSASDVVCLLTERSLDRPWILYEAGVAKGKMGTPVHGIALGVPLSRVSAGPFYQFQNSDDSEDSLAKLVLQLCRRISNLDPDPGVVANQVKEFKATTAEVLKTIGGAAKTAERPEAADEGSVAKVLEEMKLIVRDLPQRFEQQTLQMLDNAERFAGRRPGTRRFHPMMVHETVHRIAKRPGDPIGILIAASFVRDDFPWLYELGQQAYRAARGRNIGRARYALAAFTEAIEAILQGPLIRDKEAHFIVREVLSFSHHYMEEMLMKPPTQKPSIEELEWAEAAKGAAADS